MSFKPKFLVLMAVVMVIEIASSQQEEEGVVFQELDPDVIREILTDLIRQGATLKDHREQRQRTKSKLLLKESVHFETKHGDLFIVYSETISDFNEIGNRSQFDLDDVQTAKLLLSLIGGGNVKSITIMKSSSNKV